MRLSGFLVRSLAKEVPELRIQTGASRTTSTLCWFRNQGDQGDEGSQTLSHHDYGQCLCKFCVFVTQKYQQYFVFGYFTQLLISLVKILVVVLLKKLTMLGQSGSVGIIRRGVNCARTAIFCAVTSKKGFKIVDSSIRTDICWSVHLNQYEPPSYHKLLNNLPREINYHFSGCIARSKSCYPQCYLLNR